MLKREPEFEIVGEAGNGREAVELCRSLGPNLVLMDVRMPEMDSLQATRTIKRERPEIAVLMVTMHDNQDYMFSCYAGGVSSLVDHRLPGRLLELLVDVGADTGEGADVDLVIVRLDTLTLLFFSSAAAQESADHAAQ